MEDVPATESERSVAGREARPGGTAADGSRPSTRSGRSIPWRAARSISSRWWLRRSVAVLARACLLLPAPWVLPPTRLPAQAIGEQRGGGFLTGAPAVSRTEALTRCLLSLSEPFEAELRITACEVAQVLEVAPEWTAVHYRRQALIEAQPDLDTAVDQVVLYRAEGGAGRLVPRWRYEVERTFYFLAELGAVARPEGTVVELHACLNGTGGCLREYLLVDGDRLEVVAKPFVAALEASLPAELRLHKGMTLDLETLQGVWPVAAPEDPNCCPSREIAYQVRLEGASLELVRSALSPG